ncbi:MAG: hypothetical protein ACRDYB_01755 [Acidimicrobiales bacterium]
MGPAHLDWELAAGGRHHAKAPSRRGCAEKGHRSVNLLPAGGLCSIKGEESTHFPTHNLVLAQPVHGADGPAGEDDGPVVSDHHQTIGKVVDHLNQQSFIEGVLRRLNRRRHLQRNRAEVRWLLGSGLRQVAGE